MKLSAIILFLTAFHVVANDNYAQSARLSMEVEKVSIAEVLKIIENESEFFFLYSPKLIDVEQKVSFRAKNQNINTVLDYLFYGTDVRYVIKDRQIVLTTKKSSGFLNLLKQPGQGTVRGIITGSDDNAPLIAATVVVKGTTTGTVTDPNGEFSLALRSGDYTLQVSYVGYETREEAVTIEDNQITELNVALDPASFMGEEAVITAQARGQLAAVNQQLRSNQIINVVSSEKIKELPDENAAQAVSRLPGIHLDGSKVVVRGMQAKMNKILINGVEMPSTEGNDRASDLGMISANMLSGIEVFKTLTPDMDANAIGGVVNLRLREAPEGLHYSVTVQGAYNQQEKILGNYKLWGDVSNRYLDNRLGLALNLNYETYRGGDDIVDLDYHLLEQGEIGTGRFMFGGLHTIDEINSENNLGGTVVLDYRLPRGKLVYSGMLNQSDYDNLTHIDAMNVNEGYHQPQIDHAKGRRSLINHSLSYEQQIGIVELDAHLSSISMERKDEFNYHWWVHFRSMPFLSDSLTTQKKLTMQPWEAYKYIRPDAWREFIGDVCRLNPRDYSENQLLADLNVEVPLRISDQITASFKTGGKYKRMDRDYDQSEWEYNTYNVDVAHAPIKDWLISIGHDVWQSRIDYELLRDYDYEPNEGYMNGEPYDMVQVIDQEIADKMFVELIDKTKLSTSANHANADYWGGESSYAGYLMAEINLGKRLLLIPGIRYERVENDYTAQKVERGTFISWFVRDTLNEPVTHENWLPHLHARFRVTDWWDIRFSYNNTLSRPDYNHAIPSVYYHTITSSGSAGNPKIKPAVSENLDANFTFYSRKLGLFTIGGFIKTVEDVFYPQPTLLKNIPDTSIINEFPVETYPSFLDGTTTFYINNPNPAYLRGLEMEWQSNFSYLPSPFNGLVLNMNYTRVWSETKYVQHRVEKISIPTFPFVQEVENDTLFVNRLLHQANDIANISLGYDYKGFSARVSFRFQGNVISQIASRPENNSYTNDVYKYDFVMKQRLPFRFANMEVFFNAINFTNVPYRRYSIYPNKGETNTYTRYTGRQFQLGIRLIY